MTYGDLVDILTRWIKRDTIQDSIPTFVMMCGAQVQRELRVQAMLTDTTLQTGGAGGTSLTLPADCLQVYEIYRPSTTRESNVRNIPLRQVGAKEFRTWPNTNDSPDAPTQYIRRGGNLKLNQSADGTVFTIWYYQKIPDLQAAGHNWLSLRHQDVYIYGSLVQALPWLKDEKRLPSWDELYTRSLNAVRDEDNRDKMAEASFSRSKVG